jgi:hypothetical protein
MFCFVGGKRDQFAGSLCFRRKESGVHAKGL